MTSRCVLPLALLGVVAACGSAHGQDVVRTALSIDLARMRGTAEVEVRPARGEIVLDVAGLTVDEVRGRDGPVTSRVEGGRLRVSARGPTVLRIAYRFQLRDRPEGAMRGGSTLTWPTRCGNVFPCHGDPADGVAFTLALTGLPRGSTAVYPRSIATEAPPYMLAWAVGPYVRRELGATTAGTRIVVHAWRGEEDRAMEGTRHLRAGFDWLERTLGPYPFGPEAGPVAVDYGGQISAMEHHPYWHVDREQMSDEETQLHEAAHGWFGNGVRIRCWEDFVLSEGTASYLAARALGATAGPEAEAHVWSSYRERLQRIVRRSDVFPDAWPQSCGAIDVLRDRLFSDVPYMKGAFFLRAVERRVGRDRMDAALRAFYTARRGRAARFSDLLATIRSVTGFDPRACAARLLGPAAREPMPCS